MVTMFSIVLSKSKPFKWVSTVEEIKLCLMLGSEAPLNSKCSCKPKYSVRGLIDILRIVKVQGTWEVTNY